MGAETRQARAEDKVAPNIPAAIRGATPDTILMVSSDKKKIVITIDSLTNIPNILNYPVLLYQLEL